MLMHGADGKTAELRPASIKGVMRFWWRAIHGNLPLDKLHEKEGEIFGSTEGRSKVIIFPIEITKTENFQISPTPHHRQGYCSKDDKSKNCFFRNNECQKANEKDAKLYTFTLKMMIHPNDYMDEKQLENLFILATTLGGFGQRSRRGFGSVKIVGSEALTSPETIKELIKKINPKFSYTHQNKPRNEEYPYIQEIKVGKTYNTFNELLKKIGEESHNNNCDELGYAKKEGRLASPIYVSVLKFGDKDYRPVITTLKNTQSSKDGNVPNFKKAIL
jgi:CRISPR-associated protein Cmr1